MPQVNAAADSGISQRNRLEAVTGDEERNYDIGGAVSIRLVGHDPVSDIIDRTLNYFRSSPKTPDLTLVLGEYPTREWLPTGTLVGDRYFFDEGSGTTAVLNGRVKTAPRRSEVEFVMDGDLRIQGEPVTVCIPNLRTPISPGESFRHNLRSRHLRRSLLAYAGNPFGMSRVVRQAERITEAIIEPFLFYRLPAKGLSLVHATAFSSQGKATMFAGSANIGKSTLVLHYVKEKREFLGDTFVILTEGGDVMPYPGLVKLHANHLSSLPELDLRLAEGLGRFGTYLLRSELSSNPDEAFDSLPQRQMTELFKGVTIPERCELVSIFRARRGSFAAPSNEETDGDAVARALSADLYWDLEAAPWRNNQFVYSSSAALGRDYFTETMTNHERIDQIIRRGISRAKCYTLSLPSDAPVTRVEEYFPGIWGFSKKP